ncbi:hypothetical protein ACFLQY_00405 [Verrucomicrobiota bacterium]
MYIYKYSKFGSAGEIHYDTLDQALEHAISDLETGEAAPKEILNAKRELVYDLDAITARYKVRVERFEEE